MLRRLFATLLAGAMALTATPLGEFQTAVQELTSVESSTEENAETKMNGEENEKNQVLEADTEAEEDMVDSENVEAPDPIGDIEASSESDESTEAASLAEDASEVESSDELSEVGLETATEKGSDEASEDKEDKELETQEGASEDSSDESPAKSTEEKEASFLNPVEGVDISGLDFSSCELMIGTEDPGILTWDTEVLSEYRGVYLTRYKTAEQTRNAYTYYYRRAEFVSCNTTFRVADQEDIMEVSDDRELTSEDKEDGISEDDEETHLPGESADLSNLNEGDDALSNLNNMDAVRTPNRTIALIDTGVSTGDLVDAVSVIGDSTSDDNGHGTRMYQAIREEYPEAKVLSIKAMGSDGKGQASDIYAAIQYALESHVDVINLSLTANGTEENSVVVRAIEEAIGKGVTVVGAAGNNASNAKYFIPGCVEDAYIIGAANEKGDRQEDSNYGPNVDYEVVAGSTSEAAARFSALFMRSKAEGKDVTDYPNVLINYDRTDLDTDDYVLLYNNNDFNVSRAAASKTISVKIGDKTYKISIPSYLVFPINVNATDTSKYYGFAGYRNAANAKDYLGSKTFNAATGMMATGSGDSETTYAAITKNCGTYFNVKNTVAGLPDGDFKKAYGSDATTHGASDVCVYGSSSNYQTTNTGWTTNWYNNGYRVITANSNDLYSFSVFCTEAKDMSPRGAYGQLLMLPITSTNTRGYANYKVTVENNQTYVWVPYRSDEVDQNAYSGHSNWQNFIGGTYLKVPYTEEKEYYIGIYKKNDSGDPMQNITFDVKVNGTVTAKALKTGSDGIATYKVGKYAEAPKVEVQENWTNERFEPETTGYYAVNVYETEADAESHAKDAKHTWTNDQYEYYASIKKDGNKGITSTGFAGAYYGLYDTDNASKMTDDHLIAVFKMDKDGYAAELSGPTTGTVAGHTCKARLNYTDEEGWRIKRTVDGHTQYFICMGKDDLTDKKMLTNTKFAYKELVAPGGYLKSEKVIPATITKLLGVPATLTSSQIVKMIDEDWENNPTYIYLEKRSANTGCTDGNPNYSLKGATYKVFKTNAEATAAVSSRDFSKAVATLTVDEKGNSQVLEVSNYMNKDTNSGKFMKTTFYVVESKTGKGYEMDTNIHSVNVTLANSESSPAKIAVTDMPVDDPIRIHVVKQTMNGDGAGIAGAVFTVKYYAVSVDKAESFASLSSKKANRTDTYTTDQNGTFEIRNTDAFYPLGYVTIEETAAPNGYHLEGSKATAKGISIPVKMCFRLLAEGNETEGYETGKAYLVDDKGNYVLGPDGAKITASAIDSITNALTVSVLELPKRGDVLIEKRGEADEPLSGIRFEVKSETTGETHYLITDEAGMASTHKDYADHSNNTNKYDDRKEVYNGKAGTWFYLVGDKNHTQNVTDDQGALPEGWYQVKEVDSQGHQKEEVIRIQVKDGQVTNVYDSNRGDKKTYITNVKLPTLVSDAWIVQADGSLVKVSSPEKDMTIRDQVSYTNLRFNTKYTLVGKLMEIQADGSVKEIAKASKSFETAKTYVRSMYECSGDLTMDFEHLDLSESAGSGYVVFQYIYLGEEKSNFTSYTNVYPDSNNDVVAFPLKHDDPKNENQQVYTPNGETEAEDISGSKTVTYTDTVTLVDHVRYRNLQPGREYQVTGTLHVRPEDAPENAVYPNDELAQMILKDEKGNPVTAKATFVAKDASGIVDVTFTFKANLLTKEAETIVVFEDCFDKKTGVKVFTHADIHDKGQTVFHPEIKTTAMDENGRRELAHFSRKFYDVVSYDNLEAGRKYKLVGVAMDKNTGEELVLNGTKVSAEEIFTTGKSNKKNGAVHGSFKLAFTLTEEMQADLEGKDMVIFETLYAQDGKGWRVAAEHKDLSDEGQELKVPTLKTTLLDKATGTHVAYPDQIVTLVDTVVYTNLIPGKKYTMEGTLMKQPKGGENQEIFKDKTGKPVTATKDFVASETGNGVVELEFTFNAKELFVEGKSVVAFETCLPEGDLIPVAVHADIHDKDQTVDFPKVGTKAALVKKSVTENTATFEVTDQIMLSNLNTEYSYTAKGWLVDKDGNKVEIGGKTVEAEKTFTVENPNGSISITFPQFTVGKYDSFTYVVYEEVYVNVSQEDGSIKPVLVGEHKDRKDSNQTVSYRDQPQTGDETPIAIFIGLLILAMAGIGMIIWKKRKLNKNV